MALLPGIKLRAWYSANVNKDMSNTTTLKEATWEAHKAAEKTEFMRKMITGDYEEKLWVNHLTNLFLVYSVIESRLTMIGSMGLGRSAHILNDLRSITGFKNSGKIVPSTVEYIEHLMSLSDMQLIGHLYVRWLGDMNGGTMIANKCKFAHSYLMWKDTKQSIADVRDIVGPVQEHIVDEAKLAFDYATRINNDLML